MIDDMIHVSIPRDELILAAYASWFLRGAPMGILGSVTGRLKSPEKPKPQDLPTITGNPATHMETDELALKEAAREGVGIAPVTGEPVDEVPENNEGPDDNGDIDLEKLKKAEELMRSQGLTSGLAVDHGVIHPMPNNDDDDVTPIVDAEIPPPPPATLDGTTQLALDKSGLPWDERIHAGTKTKTAKDLWKNKRNVDATYRAGIEAELRGGAPAQVPAEKPKASAPVAPTPITTVLEITAYLSTASPTTAQLNAACATVGLKGIAELMLPVNHHHVAVVASALQLALA